jgi:type II secretory pathway component PulC
VLALALACTREEQPPAPASASEGEAAAECPPPELPRIDEVLGGTPRAGLPPSVDPVAANLLWIDTHAVFVASLEIHAGEVRTSVGDGRLRLDVVPESSMVAQLGLRGGDSIVAVDGEAPTAQTVLFLRDRLLGRDKVVLDLERAGAPLRIHYHVRKEGEASAPAFSRLMSLVDLAVVAGEGGAATRVDKAALAIVRRLALAGKLGSSRVREVWRTLGVPKGARVVAVDGEAVDDGTDAALALLADRARFELGIDADAAAGASKTLPFEVVEGLVRGDDLERAALAVEAEALPRTPRLGLGPTGPTPVSEELAESVVAEDETRFTIERAKLDAALTDPATTAKMARVVPDMEDGEMRGFKLYGIRKGSVPQALGFKNGDSIRSVDGVNLTTVESAMAIYAKLRKSKAGKMTVGIVRKGSPLTFEYTIR